MGEAVWISTAQADVRLIGKFETDAWTDRRELARAAERSNQHGEFVDAEACPNRIWGDDRARTMTRLPHLVMAQAHWIVSAKAAAVLRGFDLGGGALYPVRDGVFQRDNKTPVAGDMFCWIFGNVKTAFAPDQTPRKKPFGVAGLRWSLPSMLADDDIAVTDAALAGPDVWVDPTLFQSLFVSGALGDALEAAGLHEAFRLRRCRVV